jgi:hypothetical protein
MLMGNQDTLIPPQDRGLRAKQILQFVSRVSLIALVGLFYEGEFDEAAFNSSELEFVAMSFFVMVGLGLEGLASGKLGLGSLATVYLVAVQSIEVYLLVGFYLDRFLGRQPPNGL